MAAALPFISALAPILSPILGGLFAPKPQAPQLAPPPVAPAPPTEAPAQPEGVLDREAARARSLTRRRAQATRGGLSALQEEEEGTSRAAKKKTLLGS